MANGISRRSVFEAMQSAMDKSTARYGQLDLWHFAELLANDVESWGEDNFYSAQPSNTDDGVAPPPRYWTMIERE